MPFTYLMGHIFDSHIKAQIYTVRAARGRTLVCALRVFRRKSVLYAMWLLCGPTGRSTSRLLASRRGCWPGQILWNIMTAIILMLTSYILDFFETTADFNEYAMWVPGLN